VTRHRHAAALAACIAVALTTPLGGRAVSRACAAGTVHVAIVVDTGTGNSVSALCVPAGARDNGAMLLAERASMLGTPQPRYGTSGLLCAIDGFPATGCGERQNGRYAYWSYWHGSNGAWTYASVGPASTRVDPTVVEGWRWEPDGAASPVDPPPRVAPVASTICKPVPPPAPPTTAAVTTRTTVRATSPATQAIGPPGATGPSAITPIAPQPRAGAATPGPTNSGVPRPGGTTTPRRVAASRSTKPDASAPTTIALAQGGIATAAHGSGSGGTPVGLLLGGALVAALFAVGALAARRRRSTA
jgi:hypothetical protein